MEMPSVLNVFTDPSKRIRYEVMAYRKLTAQELAFAVQEFESGLKKKPTKNKMYRINSLFGLRD